MRIIATLNVIAFDTIDELSTFLRETDDGYVVYKEDAGIYGYLNKSVYLDSTYVCMIEEDFSDDVPVTNVELADIYGYVPVYNGNRDIICL